MTLERYQNLENSAEAKNLFITTINILAESKKSSISLGYNDFIKLIKSQPTLEKEFYSTVERTTVYFANNQGLDPTKLWNDAHDKAIAELKQQELISLQRSPLSRSLSTSEQSTEVSVVQSAVMEKPAVDVPSILEETFF